MPIKTYPIADFSQVSNWNTASHDGTDRYYYQSPTTDTDYKTIDLSDIPAGSVINSAYIEATFGSPNTGIAMAHTAFKLGEGAYTTGSAWDDTVNPRTEPIPVNRLAPGEITTIQFQFRANGSLVNLGAQSGSLAYADITVYVDYTEPYSKCTPPTTVAVSPVSTGKSKNASLSWSGAAGGTNNALNGYDVYRSTSPTSGFTLLSSPSASPISVESPATNGGKFYYKVVAKGAAGAIYYSDLSSAYATLESIWSDATAPNSITGPTNVVPGSVQTLSLSGAAAGVNNPITKYQVFRSDDNYAAAIAETTGTSVPVTAHAVNGSSYTYKVKAVAEQNSILSTASNTMKSLVGDITPPSSIAFDANNLAPGGQTALRWSGQAGGVNNAIVSYDVEKSTDGSTWVFVANTTNSAYSPAVASNTNNATVYYRVKIIGERANAYSSAIGLVTTVTKPAAPTSISLNDSNLPVGWLTDKTLSWSGAAAGVNNAIYGYCVMVSVNGGALVQYGSDVITANTYGSMPVTSLAANGTQKFYVHTIGATSVTAEQLSAQSSAIDTLTTAVTNPTAPTASIPTNVAPGSTQSLSWSGAQNGTNNPIVTYKIYEKIGAGAWAYKASDGTSPYTVTAPAANGETKSYYVVASGENGDSVASNTVVMTTTVSKPNAPTAVSLSAVSNLAPDADVTLSWSGASDGTYNNPVNGYRIMRSVDGGVYAQLGADLPKTTTSLVVKTKNGNGTHAFRVIALGTNLGIHSDLSSQIASAATVVSTPSAPSIVEVVNGGGVPPMAVRVLQWSGAAAGAYNNPIKGYQVYRSTDGISYSAFGSPILTTNTYYSMNVEAQSADGASYYYKVVTLGNTLSINSSTSSANSILTTEKLPSTGTLDKTSVTATGSESVSVALSPQLPAYTHKVTWYIPNTAYTSGEWVKAAGVLSDAYAIPQSWILATTKTTTSVTAKCKVETFDGAVSLGVHEYSFTVNVPTKSTFALGGVPLTASGSESATATIAAKYAGYKHTVLWSTTGYSQAHNVAAGTPTQAYAIPKAWCNSVPNATAFTVTVKVTTIKVTADGDLSLGDEIITFTANVPSDIVPTISSFTPEGVSLNWGLYVQTKSGVKWTPVAAGAYSSSIVSYKITNAHLNSGVIAYSAGANWTSGALNYPGVQTFTLEVTDSRGRKATLSGDIAVTAYSPPSIASAIFVRSDSAGVINRAAGTYINLAAAFSFSNIGTNAITAKVYYKEVGTVTWLPAGGTAVTLSGTAPNMLGSATYGAGAIAIAKLYDVKVTLTDAYSTVEAANIIPTVARVFDVRQDRAAFGGIATIGSAFQVPVGWTMYAQGNKEVFHDGRIVPIANGGTGAADAAAARTNLGITLANLGLTASAAELNKLDGATPTVMEINFLDGVTSAIQTQLNGKAANGHAHAWADITSGVPTSFTPSAHIHGNITNDGKIGAAALLPVITGTGGILQAGSFGTAAGTFCQGNDARLSDARPASDVSAWAKAANKPSYGYTEVGAAAASHGSHVPTLQTASNTIFLRNDNTWQTVTPANIGAAAASHGNHVPTVGAANNAILLRNDNTWHTVTPADIGALAVAAKAADSSKLNGVAEAEAATVSTIVKRNASGYIYAAAFNSTLGDTAVAATHYYTETGSDGWLRPKTLANVKAELVTRAAVEAVLTGAIITHNHASITGTLPIANGGTGAATAAAALIALGLSATAAELNKLDGATPTVTEINFLAGVTSAIQTQLNAKQKTITSGTAAPSGGSSGDIYIQYT